MSNFSDLVIRRRMNTLFFPQLMHNNSFNIESVFYSTKKLRFNIKNDNYLTLFNEIKKNKGCYFIFEIIDGKNVAYGNGATREIYYKMAENLIDEILVKKNTFFVDIDIRNKFWNNDDNIKSFVDFIMMVHASGSILPYHLDPIIFEYICYKKMNFDEISYFLKNTDPELYNSISKIKSSQWKTLDLEYDSKEDYMRYKIIDLKNLTRKKIKIYDLIAERFQNFDSFYDYSIIELDKKLSGPFEVTSEIFMQIINFTDESYKELWEKFILTLNSNQLKNMLILFSGTISLDNKITVDLNYNSNLDISISTCSRFVSINKKFFENLDSLNKLKIYFCGKDNMSDYILNNEENVVDETSYESNIINTFYRTLRRLSELENNVDNAVPPSESSNQVIYRPYDPISGINRTPRSRYHIYRPVWCACCGMSMYPSNFFHECCFPSETTLSYIEYESESNDVTSLNHQTDNSHNNNVNDMSRYGSNNELTVLSNEDIILYPDETNTFFRFRFQPHINFDIPPSGTTNTSAISNNKYSKITKKYKIIKKEQKNKNNIKQLRRFNRNIYNKPKKGFKKSFR